MGTLRKKIMLGIGIAVLLAGVYSAGAFTSQNGLYSVISYGQGDITNIQLYEYDFGIGAWGYVSEAGWVFHSTTGTRWYGWTAIYGYYDAVSVWYSPDGYNAYLDSYSYSNYVAAG